MSKTCKKNLIILLLLVTLLTLNLKIKYGPESVTDTLDIDEECVSSKNSPVQEILPGILFKTTWENRSQNYTDTYCYEPTSEIELENKRIVEDLAGNTYYIVQEFYNDSWKGYWDSREYIVELLSDSDKNLFVKAYSSNESLENLFFIQKNLSGDELLYSTKFYCIEWVYNHYHREEFSWYDNSNKKVDPNEIIPNLKETYEWAGYYNQTFEYSDTGQHRMFGFSINQLTLLNLTQDSFIIFEADSFFQGFSVFNDSNHNSIMDVSFNQGSDEFYTSRDNLNSTYELQKSEIIYDVWLNQYDLIKINTPKGDNNRIDWNIHITNLSAVLGSLTYSKQISGILDPEDVINSSNLNDSDNIFVTIPSVDFKFHFFTYNNDSAQLKVDQSIGSFNKNGTSSVSEKLKDLCLAINYWTTINQYYQSKEVYELELESKNSKGRNANIPEENPEFMSVEWEDGIHFKIDTSNTIIDLIPIEINFGGNYTWKKDTRDYDVNTAIQPSFAFNRDIYHQAGIEENYGFSESLVSTFYYSSCYTKWDGYGIIHDPEYKSVTFQLVDFLKPFPWLLFIAIIMTLVIVVTNTIWATYKLAKVYKRE